MLPTSVDFLVAFQGILIAGAVPVPIYPPVRLDRLQEYAQRQSAILADAEVRTLITVARAKPVADLFRSSVKSLARSPPCPSSPPVARPGAHPEAARRTRRSSSTPRGAPAAPRASTSPTPTCSPTSRPSACGLEARPTDVGVSWLPLYHDMGLIGSWLFCQTKGIPIAIQSPLSFLARPERWLWAIHERRATLSAAPNFAYELCVRRIKDEALEGLDLSSWRCALNGAEPVSPETLERFVARFSRYGFRPEAMLPVYGLAENAVAVAFPPPGRRPRIDRVAREPFGTEDRAVAASDGDGSALRFVSVGRALPEHDVKVLDGAGREVGERVVGRLAFRGPSMTSGYYSKPEATAAIRLEDGFPRQRRPRLRRRRRDLHRRAQQRPHHQGRPQPRSPGDRGGSRRRDRHPPGMRRRHRRRARGARHRAPRRGGRDSREGPCAAGPTRARGDRPRGRGGGAASRRRRSGPPGRRAQDLVGEDTPRHHEGPLPVRAPRPERPARRSPRARVWPFPPWSMRCAPTSQVACVSSMSPGSP